MNDSHNNNGTIIFDTRGELQKEPDAIYWDERVLNGNEPPTCEYRIPTLMLAVNKTQRNPIITDALRKRLEDSLASGSIQAPAGMSREEKRQFILAHAKSTDNYQTNINK